MNKKKLFDKIVKDIKEVKIQGATNIAKSALKAYSLIPTKSSKKKLLSLRPTEPLLRNVLERAERGSKKEIMKHLKDSQEKINKYTFKLIKNNDVIFTHCHSSTLVDALIYAKKKGKNFQVYNTETRPLFQGRKTARELRRAGIKVIMFIDAAAAIAIEKENKADKVYSDKVFFGADALLKDGIINKVGSNMFAKIAHDAGIPIYIISDSWKFTKKKIPIEQRKLNEIWKAPKNVRIMNPAFEFIPRKYITKIVSELGILNYRELVRKK